MKRDMDLIRKMLLAIEDESSGWAPEFQFEGYTPDQVGYHGYLLVDAGLAVGVAMTHDNSEAPDWIVTHLTWAGHEFAANARKDSRWREALSLIRTKADTVSFAVLGELLAKLAEKQLGLS
jgi:hypothetical protein